MMGVTALGLSFLPIYWTYHDGWNWSRLEPGFPPSETALSHYGHVHFWMMGFDWKGTNADAFTGQQTFQFALQDIWGPRSGDPNQQFQYTVIGTPKWYFHIEEIWRRVYIQQWDEAINIPGSGIVGRRGIRYDASSKSQTFGPFREGQGFAPLFIESARTLPVEYFTDETRSRLARDNYIKQKYIANAASARSPGGVDGQIMLPPIDPAFFDPPPDGFNPSNTDFAALPTFADGLYIYPTMEYQKTVPLNWERLPGYQAAHDIDDNNFGDGWSVEVTIPFKNPTTGQYMSPFGLPGECLPPGQYTNELVTESNRLTNRQAFNTPPTPPSTVGGYDYNNYPFGLPDSEGGQLLQFNNPYPNNVDGRWIKQCIGGICQSRCVTTIQNKLGGRQDITISSVQYLPSDNFSGTDQNAGTLSP